MIRDSPERLFIVAIQSQIVKRKNTFFDRKVDEEPGNIRGSNGTILGLVDDRGDACVLDHPGAHDTGFRLLQGLAVLEAEKIQGGAQHLVAAGRNDGVALGVDGHALFVLLPVGDAVGLPPADAHVAAVLVAPRRAVVAGGHDLVVLHDDGPILPPKARGPPRHLRRDVQVVLPLADPFHSVSSDVVLFSIAQANEW